MIKRVRKFEIVGKIFIHEDDYDKILRSLKAQGYCYTNLEDENRDVIIEAMRQRRQTIVSDIDIKDCGFARDYYTS